MCDHFLLSSFSSVSVGFFLSLLLAVHCEGRALDIYYPFGGVLQDIFSDLSFCSTLILLTLLTNTFFFTPFSDSHTALFLLLFAVALRFCHCLRRRHLCHCFKSF